MLLTKLQKTSFNYWSSIFGNKTIKSKYFELPEHLKQYILDETDLDENQIVDLKQKINSTIADEFNGKAFVKLNFSSPLDLKARGTSLCITNFDEMLKLLKKSFRTKFDLKNPFGDFNARLDYYIVIKEYCELDNDREFRIFMKNKELYFISSRYTNIITDVSLKKRDVMKISKSLIDEVYNVIREDELIIDFYITRTNDVILIDIAPLTLHSYSAQFEWNEIDKELSEVEIRFTKSNTLKSHVEGTLPAQLLRPELAAIVLHNKKKFAERAEFITEEDIPECLLNLDD